MSNLYWPMYQRLEQELINLSEFIYIDDKQLSVYSIKLAELLIRCSMEIESISKEIYSKFASKLPKDEEPYFDTDCIDLLESRWKLGSKKVILSHQNFYLSDEKRNIFPLKKANKRGKSGSKWKQAYQAVKHNRTKNIHKANIENLICAMAALYILNIYYMNKEFDVASGEDEKFLLSFSSIFTVCVHHFKEYNFEEGYIKNENIDECTYIIKWKDKYEEKMKNWDIVFNKNLNLISSHMGNDTANKNIIINRGKYVMFSQNFDFEKSIGKKEYIRLIKQAIEETKREVKVDIDKPVYVAKLNIEAAE